MVITKYSVNQFQINSIIALIQMDNIAIPQIQRPFVWDSTKVRDFIDSLYKGYPVGYIITWQNPDVKLKDGMTSKGKEIIIDGQQRVLSIMAALLGEKVIDEDFKKKNITIAFNPDTEKFEVSNSAIVKDKSWIPDISVVFKPDFDLLQFLENYCSQNVGVEKNKIFNNISKLNGIQFNSIGIIQLNSDLDIETVTEIFIRINSKGAVLSQADFAMSKIAVDEKFGGNILQKAINYFCHLAVEPSFYDMLKEIDKEFVKTDYFPKMAWLKDINDDLYDPSYTDMLRVSFTNKFKRGRLQDLVALLSGRNFETKQYEEQIAEESFKMLDDGIRTFMNQNNFLNFVMILNSAGFVDSSMIRSQNAINFSYILYLTLKEQGMHQGMIHSYVRKWFILSVLTGRYSGSPESQFDYDIKRINELSENYINDVFRAELSDAYWNFGLPQQMNSSLANSPAFNVYLAAQIKNQDKGFLSRDILVSDLVKLKGDVHHIFPREYLKKYGYNKNMYNQIANYVMAQSEINIAIGAKPPADYMKQIFEQCQTGILKYGAINSTEELRKNLEMNCIPEEIVDMDANHYSDFLEKRRFLMSQKIKRYFEIL
ncbi:MAG TPA: DUF262 domain-containing protein [Candidatus Kapabacteria bacterium]|jgi:hypothetical protein|nr:DUF262 domain-containing protein [Candidatus Kapabacteria bacterium]